MISDAPFFAEGNIDKSSPAYSQYPIQQIRKTNKANLISENSFRSLD